MVAKGSAWVTRRARTLKSDDAHASDALSGRTLVACWRGEAPVTIESFLSDPPPDKPKPPWWQLSKSPRLAIVLGVGHLVMAVFALVVLLDEPETFWFFYVGWSVVSGTAYLASGLHQRALQR
jgi:hypothetical protein